MRDNHLEHTSHSEVKDRHLAFSIQLKIENLAYCRPVTPRTRSWEGHNDGPYLPALVTRRPLTMFAYRLST